MIIQLCIESRRKQRIGSRETKNNEKVKREIRETQRREKVVSAIGREREQN